MAPTDARPFDSHAIPRRSTRVVSRMVAGEHILVPLASRGVDLDSIFNLNGTGTFIWERIDGVRDCATLATQLATEFAVTEEQAASDCREFLSQLVEVGAVEMTTGAKGESS